MMQEAQGSVSQTAPPKIVIDTREDGCFSRQLEAFGAVIERKMLEVGDFICSERLVVERKTRADFEQSVIDGRLFSQLNNLNRNYGRVVIIVEGESTDGRLDSRALLGAYTTIIADFGAAVFFTRNKDKTAELVFSLAKHEHRAKKQTMRIFAKRKSHTLSQTQRAIIEAFPMIGPKLAINILSHFGSIESFINSGENELLDVPGMGEKRAKIIKRILSKEYDSCDDKPLII
jgi:Fanconi anemia group M protein